MTPEQEEILNRFLTWFERAKPEMDTALELLALELPAEPEPLISESNKIEAHYGRCGELLSEANTFLVKASEAFWPAKEGRSEVERGIILASSISAISEVVSKLKSICKSIEQRIIKSESTLSFRKQFPHHGNT